LGVREDLELRLRRIHAGLDATSFRVRQVGWGAAGFGFGGGSALALGAGPVPVLLSAFGGLLLAFLWPEHQVTSASDRRRRAVHLELPVVAEQVATLLGAGYSLTGALDRVARRGSGAVAQDLRAVLRRVRQGVAEEDALREWAELADVPAVHRLVAVLALNREASDLGRLIAAESRAIRRDVHRELLATIERRGQQVWVPVTVATLVPGVLFLSIPFTSALAGFLG
jgi:tight adherence protein C